MRQYVCFLLACIVTAACSKKNDGSIIPPPIPGDSTLVGAIVLPSGLSESLAGWKVNSGTDEVDVTETFYNIADTSRNFNLQFVYDANGQERLMGLLYPGQTDFTISPATTITAMLMKMPAVTSLTTEGKLNFMRLIQQNAHYGDAVKALENRIIANQSIFDTADQSFNEKFSALFESAAASPLDAQDNRNVTILRAGRELIFQNAGKSFTQVIGIYRNNTRLEKIVLDRFQYFVGSISQIPAFYSGTNPIEKAYTLPEVDGDYEIRMSTGRGANNPLYLESQEAKEENFKNIVSDVLLNVLPDFGCVGSMRKFAADVYQGFGSVIDQKFESKAQLQSFVIEVSQTVVNLIKTADECYTNTSTSPIGRFFESAKKYLNVVKYFSYFNQGMNQTISIYQFFNSPAVQDTCFAVEGDIVTTCNDSLRYYASLVPGTWRTTYLGMGDNKHSAGPMEGSYDWGYELNQFHDDGSRSGETSIEGTGWMSESLSGDPEMVHFSYSETGPNSVPLRWKVDKEWDGNYYLSYALADRGSWLYHGRITPDELRFVHIFPDLWTVTVTKE